MRRRLHECRTFALAVKEFLVLNALYFPADRYNVGGDRMAVHCGYPEPGGRDAERKGAGFAELQMARFGANAILETLCN